MEYPPFMERENLGVENPGETCNSKLHADIWQTETFYQITFFQEAQLSLRCGRSYWLSLTLKVIRGR